MAAPIPPLLRPERIPRLLLRQKVENGVRYTMHTIAKPWVCDACGAVGDGDASDGFAHEEAEHCLTGCNGSLRSSGADRDSAPALPDADLSLNGLPLAK